MKSLSVIPIGQAAWFDGSITESVSEARASIGFDGGAAA